ncbi:hypothetical protein [Brevibacillus parabrevis]|uniref:hypothetical protein n=1 Tax=Brevibacillus parabrevis TaxID=54914 RepID=UPI0028D8601F|nr:hypothetical protein [Brevibacillus parabrevis]
MRSVEVLEANPLTDSELDFEEVLGYVITAAANLGIAETRWQHLAREMVLVVEKTASTVAEETYIAPAYVRDGIMSLSKWTIAKAKLNNSIDPKEKVTLMGNDRLENVIVTERQAVGYMILAAKNLGFLHEQIKVLEMELHYLLVTMDIEEAFDAFLDFLHD